MSSANSDNCTCAPVKWSLTRSILVGVYLGVYAVSAYKNGFSSADVGQILGVIAIITGVDITKAVTTK